MTNGLILVVDACMAITFGAAGQLKLVLGSGTVQPAIGAKALTEVKREPARGAVQAAVQSGRLLVERIDLAEPDESRLLAEFDARPAFRGRGDAEVLALAASRGHLVGTDDHAMQSAATLALGPDRIVSTLDILVWAIREGRLSVPEADRLLGRLDIGPEIQQRLRRAGVKIEDLV